MAGMHTDGKDYILMRHRAIHDRTIYDIGCYDFYPVFDRVDIKIIGTQVVYESVIQGDRRP